MFRPAPFFRIGIYTGFPVGLQGIPGTSGTTNNPTGCACMDRIANPICVAHAICPEARRVLLDTNIRGLLKKA